MKKVVSVIIPVYNVEEFIFRTVESVMNQDYKNIEIILVDDGSPDNSAEIIDKLAKKDDRITCVHKENGGVSSARNAGLRIASGEYVTFIDGDDWAEPKYVSYLLNLVESNKCEIGMNKNNYSDYNTKSNEEEYVVSAEKAIEWIYLGDIFVAVWNKIYSMQFLKKNNILFDEKIWYGEGMLFNIDCLQFVDRFVPFSIMLLWAFQKELPGESRIKFGKTVWQVTKTVAVFSLLIEFLQLLFHLGTFQFSDLTYNTFGGAVGGVIYYMGYRFISFLHTR